MVICEICGIESTFDAAFKKEAKSFRSGHRVVCPKCSERRHSVFRKWSLGLMLVVGVVILFFDHSSFLGHLFLDCFLLKLFIISAIVPHELGHAFAARLVGWRVFLVIIGVGKPFFKKELLGCCFEFRKLPVAGLTLCVPITMP
jgi:hypothetical protein